MSTSRMGTSRAEDNLVLLLQGAGLPAPRREHRWHPTRKWRFDLAWPELMLAIEVEGGTFQRTVNRKGEIVLGSGHAGQHFIDDCEKYNSALVAGWHVVRIPSQWCFLDKEGLKGLRFVEEAYKARAAAQLCPHCKKPVAATSPATAELPSTDCSESRQEQGSSPHPSRREKQGSHDRPL